MGMYRVCFDFAISINTRKCASYFPHNLRIFSDLYFLSHYGDSNPGPTHYEDREYIGNERVMNDGKGMLP